jgi:hypothetical protein
MDKQTEIIKYGHNFHLINGKLHIKIIKSDFDKIRELNKLHHIVLKQILELRQLISTPTLTLMCSYFHGQPYK